MSNNVREKEEKIEKEATEEGNIILYVHSTYVDGEYDKRPRIIFASKFKIHTYIQLKLRAKEFSGN